AEGLHQHRPDRVRGGLSVNALTEAVAHAILAGGVIRAGDRDRVEHLLALDVEPVISTILFSVMKRCCASTALFGFAAESATTSFTSLPSTPLVVFGE